MRKDILAKCFMGILMTVMLAGCVPGNQKADQNMEAADKEQNTGAEATDAKKESGKPLRVGTMAMVAGIPVKWALDHGYFEEEGIEVEMTIFATGAPVNEAMAASELDIGSTGAAAIFSLATGETVLLHEQMSSGGMGIWVRPDSDILSVKGQISWAPEMYGSAEVLKGKKIICQAGTSSEYNALRYIDSFGLTSAEVELIYMDYGAGVQAFISGEGDAIATLAPYSNQAETEAGAVKCCTFEEATQSPLNDMIFCRKEVLENRREDVLKYMRATWRAIEDLQDDEVRKEFSMKWFAENGREYDDATMDQEIADRRFLTKEDMLSEDYALGKSVVPYAEFNVQIGNLTEAQIGKVRKSFDSTIMSEVLGEEVPVYSK